MSNPEKFFISQLKSHHCQLPPSDDYEFARKIKKFQNYFLISEKNLLSYLKAKSLSAIYYEKRRQIRTTQILIIHPYSEFHRGWQLWMCFVLLLALTIFPFSSAFHGPVYAKVVTARKGTDAAFYGVLSFVFVIRIFCLVEICVNFITGYVNESTNEIVLQPLAIARRYLSTYFIFDLISSIPFDFVRVIITSIESYSVMTLSENTIISVLPLFKLVRIRTLYVYFNNIYGYFSASYSVCKMVAAIFLYFLIIHWAACLNSLVPHLIFYGRLSSCTTPPCSTSWVKLEKIVDKDIFEQYLYALERSVSCFTGISFKTSSVKNTEDKIIVILIGLIGKIYWIFLLVVFLQMLSTIRKGKTRYLEMMDQVNEYMNQKKFPPGLRKKITDSYQYLFQQEYVGESGILKLLSENLQQETVLRMHQNLIEKIQIFAGLSQTFVYSVVSRLKPEMYLTNDVVYRPGEIGHFMYFVSFGTLSVLAESGRELCHMEDGEYFGEVSLIFQVRRGATVIAIEPTQLYRLGIRDFNELIKSHPLIYPKMEKIAAERFKRCHDVSSNGKKDSISKQTSLKETEDEEEEDDEFDDDELEEDYVR